METAGEYFDRGYNVYLEFKVHRFPGHPTLGKKKYRVDIMADNGKERLLIEVGYCTQAKIDDLKHLCPNCRIIRVLQWKNFFIRPKFTAQGYTCEVSSVTINRQHIKWSSLEIAMVNHLIEEHRSYTEIATYFPYHSLQSTTGLIHRLYRSGKIKSKPRLKCTHWNKTERSKLISLWNAGLSEKQLIQNFSNRSVNNINGQLRYLREKHRIKKRGHCRRWSEKQNAVLVRLWHKGLSIPKIQKHKVISVHTLGSVSAHCNNLVLKGKLSLVWTPEEDALLVSLRKQQMIVSHIARQLPNHTKSNIRKRIRFLKDQKLICDFGMLN
jgi:hypothetical protein